MEVGLGEAPWGRHPGSPAGRPELWGRCTGVVGMGSVLLNCTVSTAMAKVTVPEGRGVARGHMQRNLNFQAMPELSQHFHISDIRVVRVQLPAPFGRHAGAAPPLPVRRPADLRPHAGAHASYAPAPSTVPFPCLRCSSMKKKVRDRVATDPRCKGRRGSV